MTEGSPDDRDDVSIPELASLSPAAFHHWPENVPLARERLMRFYLFYRPEKIADLDTIIEAYGFDFNAIFNDLEEKYGPEPVAFVQERQVPTLVCCRCGDVVQEGIRSEVFQQLQQQGYSYGPHVQQPLTNLSYLPRPDVHFEGYGPHAGSSAELGEAHRAAEAYLASQRTAVASILRGMEAIPLRRNDPAAPSGAFT